MPTKEEQERAATKIQASVRGKQARRKAKKKKTRKQRTAKKDALKETAFFANLLVATNRIIPHTHSDPECDDGGGEYRMAHDHMAQLVAAGFTELVDAFWQALADGQTHDPDSLFKQYDTDGSGKLSLKELQRALKRLDLKAAGTSSEQLLSTMDQGGDGEIDIQEFESAMPREVWERLQLQRAEDLGIDFDGYYKLHRRIVIALSLDDELTEQEGMEMARDDFESDLLRGGDNHLPPGRLAHSQLGESLIELSYVRGHTKFTRLPPNHCRRGRRQPLGTPATRSRQRSLSGFRFLLKSASCIGIDMSAYWLAGVHRAGVG